MANANDIDGDEERETFYLRRVCIPFGIGKKKDVTRLHLFEIETLLFTPGIFINIDGTRTHTHTHTRRRRRNERDLNRIGIGNPILGIR